MGSNFASCVLRDYYGTTQVVIENEEMMRIIKPINKESTISVTGTVRERESKNPKLPTGDIEVVPEKIEVLGKCIHNQLPFEINKSKDADENTRQGVELAGVLSCGNEIVARALGGGGGEDRRCYLKEIMLHHCLAQSGNDVAAQYDILLYSGVSQIEIAVLQAHGLVCLAAAVYLKRQLVTRTRAATAPPASSISSIWRCPLPARRMFSPS